jgi:indole-3-glycerol phosphate synthase
MDVLERIVEAKRADLAREMDQVPPRRQIERALAAAPPLDFVGALRGGPGGRLRIIAEVKRGSPSRGGIQAAADPATVARAFAAAGAAAISVLTEARFFLGAPEHLADVRSAVRVPLLRKDFLFDEYQVYESRALSADALLLIARVLKDRDLERLIGVARSLHMEALVEVHSEEEIARAAACGAQVIGVNNRDLATLEVSLETSLRLADRLPAGIVKVSESGIESPADIARLVAAGYDAFLVGERLMREADPGAALSGLLGGA